MAAIVAAIPPESLPQRAHRAAFQQRELQIRTLADAQHGVVARRQLLALGLADGAIAARLAGGKLHRVHHGVFALGRPDLSPRGHRMAAVLACGPTAVLSHRSAAAHWSLLQTSQSRIDVTVPGTSRAQRPGIRVHRARTMSADETTTLDGIPVTTLARTLLDLAEAQPVDRVLRAVEQAEREGLLDLTPLLAVIERHPRKRGTPKLRLVLDRYAHYGTPATRSELERDFLALIDRAGLPRPRCNVEVAGLLVDCHWPQARLVVELDSRAFHTDTGAFERDRVRDARLQRAGQRVLRVTHLRIKNDGAGIVADIRALAAQAALG